MSEPVRLDDKDRKLILRCRKAQKKLKDYGGVGPSLMMCMVWLGLGLWVVALVVFGGLLLVKGSGSLPSGSGATLVGGVVWIGVWYVAAKTQAFQEDLVRLVCKLAHAVESDRSLNADTAEPK